MKKIFSIALLLSVIFVNANLFAMYNNCNNCNNTGKTNSNCLNDCEQRVKDYKDEKAKEVLAREKIENRKKFFGKIASLTIATASVVLGLGSVYLTNTCYKKAYEIESQDKRDLCRLAVGIGSVCVPVLGMFALDSAERHLGKYSFESCSVGSVTTNSLRIVSCAAVFVNCCKGLIKTIFPPQN